MNSVQVRQFGVDEWERFRDVRLRALLADPGVFSSRHDVEVARDEAHWRGRLCDAAVRVFGVFEGERVIGMTGTYVLRDDPAAVGLWGSWLEPPWRGRGLSALLYAARLAWARARGSARVVMSHRASNLASMQANQRQGFVLTGRESVVWPDGVTEDEVSYVLRL